ncbi:MAG: transposase [Gallionella sp.]
MNKRKPYKTYTKEFKLEAVRLMETSDRPAAEIATELGIRRNQLYKWKEQLSTKGKQAFTRSAGRPKKAAQSDLTTLRQENERLKEENDILKKAAAYFARELK